MVKKITLVSDYYHECSVVGKLFKGKNTTARQCNYQFNQIIKKLKKKLTGWLR